MKGVALRSSGGLAPGSANGARSSAHPGSHAEDRSGEAVGVRSRRLEARLYRLRLGATRRLARRIAIRLLDLVRIAWYAPRLGAQVRREFGVPILRQLRDQFRLALEQGVDPTIYYFEELYRPGALAKLDRYFLRREVKGLLVAELHRLEPPAAERRINLGDKLQVSAWCARTDLPHAAPLMLIEDGQSVWQTGNLLDLDQDLFVKPRIGRGAAGVQLYRRTAAFHYADENGRKMSLGDIVSTLIRKFGTRNLMVLPRLRNHPALSDLATQSLIVIRCVTCLDEQRQPELVVAYLRVLAKLELDWPVKKPIEEFACAVDLQTGRLDLMTGDKPECLSVWYDRHPVTGVDFVGRTIPDWAQVVELAERAHRVIRDRVLIGWDIAVTPNGPVLIEGNSYPDVHYPQRIHRRPYGDMRIGELLQHHLARLEAKLDAEGVQG